MILKKEQSVVIPLLKAFSAEYERVRTGMYFFEHKRVVEIDEKGHTDRNQNEENERPKKLKNILIANFFHRINPDAESFDIFLEISKINNYIIQSNEGKIKEQKNKIKNKKTK